MTHLLFFAAVVLAAAAFAALEVQIEGGEGWAAGLPTWEYDRPWVRRLLGGRLLTGYHLYSHLTVLALLHSAYVLAPGAASWAMEGRLLAFYILFWIFEDFLWFVFNPKFGLRRFRPQDIPWHAHSWWWIAPREYWVGLPVGVGLYFICA